MPRSDLAYPSQFPLISDFVVAEMADPPPCLSSPLSPFIKGQCFSYVRECESGSRVLRETKRGASTLVRFALCLLPSPLYSSPFGFSYSLFPLTVPSVPSFPSAFLANRTLNVQKRLRRTRSILTACIAPRLTELHPYLYLTGPLVGFAPPRHFVLVPVL